MISLERVRELVGDPTMPDSLAEAVRDECRCLAELLLDAWENSVSSAAQHADETKRPASAPASLKEKVNANLKNNAGHHLHTSKQ